MPGNFEIKDDSIRQSYWLDELLRGAQADIPRSEKKGLSLAFLDYCSSLIKSDLCPGEVLHDDALDRLVRVHERVTKALVNGDEFLFDQTWKWTLQHASMCGADASLQVLFIEGFLNDIVYESEDNKSHRIDMIRCCILTSLNDKDLRWITLRAYEEDLPKLLEDLLRLSREGKVTKLNSFVKLETLQQLASSLPN